MNTEKVNLMKLFFRTEALLHRHHGFYARQFGPFGNPHRGQSRILSLLKLQPEMSQKDLAYLLDMRNQSLSELLVKLERSGYISRAASPQDRRVLNITLTEAGKEAANQVEDVKSDSSKVFNCLSEEEQDTLANYLQRINDSLEQDWSEHDLSDRGPLGPHDHMRRGGGHPFFHRHGDGRPPFFDDDRFQKQTGQPEKDEK